MGEWSMVFCLFSFSCLTETKSFRMRAYFHLMVRNETGLILGTNFSFSFFFLRKFWHGHAKFLHKCVKWSRRFFLLQSLSWISHSHAKCSHDDAKWLRWLKFLQLSLSVSHSHMRISHDHANWGKDSFCTFPKLWKLPCFWHELSCFGMTPLFWHEGANWCWAIKTHFSFASLFPSIRKVLQNTTDMIKNGSFIKTKKIIQHKNKTKKY